MKPGTKVLITEDCRPGHNATGQIGVYEGDFPLSFSLGYQPFPDDEVDWKGEVSCEGFWDGTTKTSGPDGVPLNTIFEEWIPGSERPRPFFAMPMNNPRIRLSDGSVIWGAECWWGVAEDGLSLEDAQKETEATKHFIRMAFSKTQ